MSLRCFLLSCLAFLTPLVAPAQLFGGKSHLHSSLVAETSTVVAGKPFTAGLLLKMDPGWHTYWQFPGDAGGAPQIEWKLPPGFKAGSIQWPVPHSEKDEADFLSFIYEDEVLLPVEITPPADLPVGEITLAGHLKWLVCQKSCMPGQGDVSLKLTSGEAPTPANAELFAHWRGLLPKSPSPYAATWITSDPKQIKIALNGVPADTKLDFFPLPPHGWKPGHPAVGKPSADGKVEITVPIETAGESKDPWRGLIVKLGGAEPEGWVIDSSAPAAAAVPAPEPPAPPPPPVATPAPVVVAATPAPVIATPAPVPAAVVETPSSDFKPLAPTPRKETRSLGLMLCLAFLGGLILNFMPCVLPVIALKIFGFMRQCGEDPSRICRLGLAFVAGVFTFFLGIALAVIGLKAFGHGFNWGFQFQNAYVLAGLIGLIFIFGLNLLGVFEITLASGATSAMSEMSSKEGYGGAFVHGLFTTLLGTSCTAPFLATTLGYAVGQPAPLVVLLFLTIASGMSLPYFLLTMRPAWMKFLPKPGMWMDRFKQVMGFIMLCVVVWLFGVFAARGAGATAALSQYLLALGFACWLLGIISNRGVAAVIALAIIFGGYFALLRGRLEAMPAAAASTPMAETDGIPWQPYSDQKLASAVQRGQPVFIDFTADWCINCQIFERVVLKTDAVRDAFAAHKVLALKADWSNADPLVTRKLNEFGAVGVPLYVLYRPGEATPVTLDALTKQILLSNLSQIKGAH